MDLESKKTAVINSIVDKFKFEDEKKELSFLEGFEKNIVRITDQYRFKKSDDLMTLLEGLADEEFKGVTYWDYIEVDTLLSLQKTKTNHPDEVIFIAYHQICELNFKLIIQELEFLSNNPNQDLNWITCLDRVARYFINMVCGMNVLRDGLNGNQFSKFRKALLPASGFQTYQFRQIEIMLAGIKLLLDENIPSNIKDKVDKFNSNGKIEFLEMKEVIDYAYWKQGTKENANDKKPAKLLKNFNDKYDLIFTKCAIEYERKNVYKLFSERNNSQSIIDFMKKVEEAILVWKLAHLKVVSSFLPPNSSGTWGLNWDIYLPIKNQKIFYFPIFWTNKEKINSNIDIMLLNFPKHITTELERILDIGITISNVVDKTKTK